YPTGMDYHNHYKGNQCNSAQDGNKRQKDRDQNKHSPGCPRQGEAPQICTDLQ
ncbi:Hypothetical predicted protein, partial [Pelobates cultripes]